MTVQTQYRVPAVEKDTRTDQTPQQRRTPIVIGVVVTLALLAAVVVVGRVATTRTTPATTTSGPAATTTGELNAKALADRYSTAGMAPSVRDDTGAWLHRRSITAPSGVQSGYGDATAVARRYSPTTQELNAKALADRYSTAGMAPSVRDDTGAWLHRAPAAPAHELNAKAIADRYSTAITGRGGVQPGSYDGDAVRAHLPSQSTDGSGVILRRHPRTVTH